MKFILRRTDNLYYTNLHFDNKIVIKTFCR